MKRVYCCIAEEGTSVRVEEIGWSRVHVHKLGKERSGGSNSLGGDQGGQESDEGSMYVIEFDRIRRISESVSK